MIFSPDTLNPQRSNLFNHGRDNDTALLERTHLYETHFEDHGLEGKSLRRHSRVQAADGKGKTPPSSVRQPRKAHRPRPRRLCGRGGYHGGRKGCGP